MDPITLSSVTSGATSAGCCLIAIVSCIVNKVKAVKNAHFILVPAGKSSLVNAFAGTPSFTFIDLDALAYEGEDGGKAIIKSMLNDSFETFKIKFFPVIKNQVTSLMANLNGSFVFVTSNYDLLKHVCNIRSSASKLHVFLPSSKFREVCLLSSDKQNADPSFVNNYNSILRKFGNNNRLNTFSSWADLQNQVSDLLNISAKL